jgi:phosphate uptake regulator
MEKKLTAQGPKDRKSYTLTLPKDWIRDHNLSKLKLVSLDIVGKKLIISPEKEVQEIKVIDGESYKDTLVKVLQSLYRSGVDEIKLFYKTSQVVKKVTDILNRKLIGYEVIEHNKDYLIIKDITRESREEFDTIIRRIFLLILELVKSNDENQINSIHENIKKLINYCQRVLIKEGYFDYVRIPFYYLLLDQLEKLADEYSWILNVQKKNPENTKLLKDINLYLRKAYELYYRFDPQEYNKYEYKTYQIKREMKSMKKLTVVDLHLHNIIRQLNSIYGNIFALRSKH